MNWASFAAFIALFALATVLGFVASHWRRGDLGFIDDWGLSGRRLVTSSGLPATPRLHL